MSVLAANETKPRLVLLTGRPGAGKTTVVSRAILMLRTDGLSVGGIYSKEKRAKGMRVGFEMVDLATDRHEELASTSSVGPRMGRYRVNLKGLAEFAAPSITTALTASDVVVCDEVGPMELMSPEFRRAAESLLSTSRPCVVVVHGEMADPLIDRMKKAPDALLLEVNDETRSGLSKVVYQRVKVWLAGL